MGGRSQAVRPRFWSEPWASHETGRGAGFGRPDRRHPNAQSGGCGSQDLPLDQGEIGAPVPVRGAEASPQQGSLVVVGSGIKFALQTTEEARRAMASAQKLLYLFADPVPAAWV